MEGSPPSQWLIQLAEASQEGWPGQALLSPKGLQTSPCQPLSRHLAQPHLLGPVGRSPHRSVRRDLACSHLWLAKALIAAPGALWSVKVTPPVCTH